MLSRNSREFTSRAIPLRKAVVELARMPVAQGYKKRGTLARALLKLGSISLISSSVRLVMNFIRVYALIDPYLS
jgi:hypothetical protein